MSSESAGAQNQPAIRISRLSKTYQIYRKPWDRMKQMLWRNRRQFYSSFPAVSNVNCCINRGETVGIVGRNGSGKTTMLKLICGLLYPTGGSVEIRGSVAPLLSIGSAFNPAFTGIENIRVSAAILGMTESEIDDRFDAIASFADIGEFLERPVGIYSSGMQARLAFAIASSMEPDILVIDEILSVGDGAFARKCYARIEDIKSRGATILLVSHSLSTVQELCDRALLMEEGRILIDGDVRQVVTQYERLLNAARTDRPGVVSSIVGGEEIEAPVPDADSQPAGCDDSVNALQCNAVAIERQDPGIMTRSIEEYGQGAVTISNVRVVNGAGQNVNVLCAGMPYRYVYDVSVHETCRLVRCGMLLKTVSGLSLGGLATHEEGAGLDEIYAGETLRVEFPIRAALRPGNYFLNAGVQSHRGDSVTFEHRVIDAMMIRVESDGLRLATVHVDFRSPGENPRVLRDVTSRQDVMSGGACLVKEVDTHERMARQSR